ncbi:MAG: L,D-transpeptidase family protein [Nitratireductor sp.]
MHIVKSARFAGALALYFATLGIATMVAAPGALAQTTAAPVVRDKPRNLFEALFPRVHQERIRREGLASEDKLPVVEITKVSAPKYFTYKADPLVSIDLSSLVPPELSVPAIAQPAVANDQTETQQPGVSSSQREASQQQDIWLRLASQFDRLEVMSEKEVSKAITDYYAAARKPFWIDDDMKPNARARSVLPVLAGASRYGLDPDDYSVDMPLEFSSPQMAAEEASRFEIEMMARVLRYAMDAKAGRVNPNRISEYHDFPNGRASAAAIIKELTAGSLPAPVLEGYNPQNVQFKALMAELDALQHASDSQIVIAPGTVIKPGETNAETANVVAAIAAKASAEMKAAHAGVLERPAGSPPLDSFTPEVVSLVKDFQKQAGLVADGVVGPNTIRRLVGVSVEDKRQRVRLAMERLRWLPREFGSRYVFINQPAFTATYMSGGEDKLSMRVVIGQKSNQTYFFYDTIETVEYNPYWGVPRSILVNEFLPKLRENPAYLDERGYEVTDSKGRQIASSAINWNQVGSNPEYDVRQSPGEANALGELKILFPNKHAIYMHDTPAKSLFNRDVRALSHGCVRLQHPREMAAAVLGTSVSYVSKKLGEGHGSDEVKGNIPVYVSYFTAWPDADGKVRYFADIYDRDAALMKALNATAKIREHVS